MLADVEGRTGADVVIVGGGPAGASAAWHIARSGLDVLILDRASFPRDKVCAEYLSPQASRILSQMNALDAIDDAGAAHLSGMRVRAPSGREIEGSFAARHGFAAFRDRGLAVRRTILDSILLQRAREAGARVSERTKVMDVVRSGTGRVIGVSAVGADGQPVTIDASLVIGADGLHTVVGRRLDLTRVARRPRRIALVAHYTGISGVGEYGEMHVERDGYIGIADVGNDVANVALVVPVSRSAGLAGDPAGFMRDWIMRRPHLARRFSGATRLDDVRATGPFASRARRAWAPGAALVGDAADFFDPFTGEGVYSALRGGELLAPFAVEAVRSNNEIADAHLRDYDAARRAEFGGKWLVERLIAGTIAVPALINHAARSLSRRREMADLLVGVVGDFVPARQVLRAGYFARLLLLGV